MKFVKRLFQWIFIIVFGAVIIVIAAMFFMFVAANVGGIGGRTISELHSDLVEVENSVEIVPEHSHDGMYGPVKR